MGLNIICIPESFLYFTKKALSIVTFAKYHSHSSPIFKLLIIIKIIRFVYNYL